MNFISILMKPYIWFYLSCFILIVSLIRKNNNFIDIRPIFIQQLKIFKDCKEQLINFYVVPLFLTIGSLLIKRIDEDIVNNIIIVLSILISMFFASLSILTSFQNKNDNYLITLKETYNTVMFEVILCIIVLILSFIKVFTGNYKESVSLTIISGLVYYLMFTIILQIFIIMKRMKALFDFRN